MLFCRRQVRVELGLGIALDPDELKHQKAAKNRKKTSIDAYMRASLLPLPWSCCTLKANPFVAIL